MFIKISYLNQHYTIPTILILNLTITTKLNVIYVFNVTDIQIVLHNFSLHTLQIKS